MPVLHASKVRQHQSVHSCEHSHWHTTRFFKSNCLSTTEAAALSSNKEQRTPYTVLIPDSSSWRPVGSDFSGNPPCWINVSWITNGTINQEIYGLWKGWRVYSHLPVNTWCPLGSTLSLPGNSTCLFWLRKRILTALVISKTQSPLRFGEALHAAPCHTGSSSSQEVAERLNSPKQLCLAAVKPGQTAWKANSWNDRQKTSEVSFSLTKKKRRKYWNQKECMLH